MVVLHTLQKTVIFSLISIFSGCLPAIQAASHPYLQAIHVLDPGIWLFFNIKNILFYVMITSIKFFKCQQC